MTGQPPTGTATTTAGTPRATPSPPDHAGAFVTAAGLRVDAVSPTRVSGHIDLDDRHHTPWGIVHGGVYATAIESGASIGACAAVADRGQVAVGLTNTTHFLRSLTAGRVDSWTTPSVTFTHRNPQLVVAYCSQASVTLPAASTASCEAAESSPVGVEETVATGDHVPSVVWVRVCTS